MRYRLRTLLIVLAICPPVLAGAWVVGNEALVRLSQTALPKTSPANWCGSGRAAVVVPVTPEDKQQWEHTKAASQSLGAPQPAPLPEGY
jgi:hypothetical protein